MVGTQKGIFIFLIADQNIMLKAHASDGKTFSWRILLISSADQTTLIILFNRMTGPLKLWLCSNTSNSKWIIVKLVSHLWQVALQIPKRRSCHDYFWQDLLSNSQARELVVTLMITSDNFLGNNPFPTESPQSSFCHVNDYLWHIISYGIHFLTPQWVSGRLSSKSIVSLFSPQWTFLVVTLTIYLW